MMEKKFDFDTVIQRRGTNSFKWDTPEEDGVLPMWVADMDFRTAPCIIEAVQRRAEHGIFGYTKVPEAYYGAVVDWFSRRHGWQTNPSSIIYTTGVVPAISAIIKAMTQPGDRIIVQTPAYNCFYSSIRNNGCELLSNPLIYQNGTYAIDFDDLERKAADERATLMLLCNPHNPAGRVWTRNELMRIGEICLRNHVFIIADEIHCELTFEGHDYTPFASLSEAFALHSASCVSPSKAFNIAGLQIANIVAADEETRRRIDRAINDNEVCDVNPFGVDALIAAYNEGGEWLDALRSYLWNNYRCVRKYFDEHLPQYAILPLEGTYLVWIDISSTGIKSDRLSVRLLNEAKLMVSPGTIYGPGGENFIRLNIACPKALLTEGLNRLETVLHG
jgi:cystathionine beta-lyase